VWDQSKIDQLAAHQYGVINNRQLREAGFDKSAVLRRVESGHWIRLDHGVYCVASAPPKWERLLSAAVLSRKSAVITGKPAAHLAGLRGFGRVRPVIYVRRGENPRSRLARIVQTSVFDQIAITRISGFEVTTVSETLLVLAGTLLPTKMEAAFDDAFLSHKLDLRLLDAVIDRETGRRTPGLARLRRLAQDRSPTAPSKESSYLEAMLESVLARGDLPPYTREHPFTISSRRARVDLYIPTWSLVVEADGRSWHGRTDDFETDRRRDNELAGRGIQVLRFTYRMLSDDPDGCLRTILDVGRVRVAPGRAQRDRRGSEGLQPTKSGILTSSSDKPP